MQIIETISDDSVVFNYFCDNGRISVKYDRNPAAESWDSFLARVKTAAGGEYESLSGADGEYLLIRGANHDYLLRNTGDGFLSLTLDKGVLETVGLDKLAVKRIDLGLSIQK